MSKAIYPSKYTDRKVTDSQYLTDEIMDRIAKKEKTALPYKYWNDTKWKKTFLRQLAAANLLLKEATCVDIMAFLRSVKGKYIFSLGLKKQILEGCKHSVYTKCKSENIAANCVEIDPFIEEIPEDEIITSEPKPSLWEKLG